jgi:ABC-type uncharacterized transport system substrate-binding protein
MADEEEQTLHHTRAVRFVTFGEQVYGRILLILLFLLWLPFAAGSAAAAPPKNILIIFQDGRFLPANIIIGQQLAAAFDNPQYHYFTEFLDITRFPPKSYPEDLAKYLRAKYKTNPPDVIIPVGPGALQFLREHRTELFPRSPIVFAAADSIPSGKNLPSDTGGTTGVRLGWRDNIVPTVALALKLHPKRTHLYVVSGASAFDRHMQQVVQNAEPTLKQQGVQVTYLAGMDLAELRQCLTALPPDAFILWTTYFADPQDNAYQPRDVLEELAPFSSAPFYGMHATYVGVGLVGGVMTDFETVGSQTVMLVERTLRGEKANAIPIVTPPASPVLDARQMARWGVPYNRAPGNAEIKFLQPTVFETYHMQILSAGGLFSAQSALVVALLLQGRRRRAEKALKQEGDNKRGYVWRRTPLGWGCGRWIRQTAH